MCIYFLIKLSDLIYFLLLSFLAMHERPSADNSKKTVKINKFIHKKLNI